ncbi:hypothetical protein PFICI_07150 [Pestalotiopsis fici W106-1]|uniref:Enterotoxin n=1 Tax=Pestalotiopsis fici (strain W106-1 / CGMCC3.15140) TaxID=1229662 RepID=W3X7P9_PESFW|nr:uncharacterized protein PFICI_07150 [Pestalotiopsis fici W106-1]ETS82148.1 hypothetical protein PFICI_07150 [Pestalotiopsis fici W106-1]
MWAIKQCGAAFATLLLLESVAATEQKPLLGNDASQGTTDNFAASASAWRLNFSSTAPYLFSSVSSLLQQWGNTFFPNGHNIVPCEIPAYTLFYHGRLDGDQPPSPEWLAFDIEMSYGIMGSTRNSHMLTYQTTKPVKALYFDGESATLMGMGQMDTQMLHVFGNISGPPHDGWGLYLEYARATGLCDWLESAGLRGDGWGYEGIIRMNAGFEMIWCDFTSPSLRLLTHLNVTAPQLPKEKDNDRIAARKAESQESSYYPLPPLPTRTDHSTDPTDPPRPPNWRWEIDREPFLRSQGWGWFSSATYHYGKSRQGPGLGEVRAKASNCGIMSYYSPRFANLTRVRAEGEQELYNLTAQGYWKGEGPEGNRTTGLADLRRRRRYHHLGDVTSEEALLMRNNSQHALKNLLKGSNDCSGADWVYISNEITQNTGIHLKEMTQLLDSFSQHADNETAIESWMSTMRAQSHSFYVAFLEYPSSSDSSDWTVESRLYSQTYARCRYRYTRLLAPIEGFELTPEEEDLRWAIEETYGAICSVLLTIGFQIEGLWAEDFNKADRNLPSPAVFQERYTQVARTWNDGLQELMAWLGWEDEFTGCSEVCQWDERCYIPMWPLMALGGPGGPRPPRRGNGTFPGPHYPPHGGYGGYGPYGGPPHRGPSPPGGGPDRNRPRGGGSWFMGDETELWEPTCAKATHFMRS